MFIFIQMAFWLFLTLEIQIFDQIEHFEIEIWREFSFGYIMNFSRILFVSVD